jgi:hypothetical protein
MFVRKFSKVLKSKRGGYGMRGKRDHKKTTLCFECDSPNHLIVDCPIKKEKDKKKAYKGKKSKSMTFKKTKDGGFVCTWDSDGESDDEDDEQVKRKAMISIGHHKKPSLFGSSPSCFMAKGSKVYHSDSDNDEPCANEVKYDDSGSEDENDEPTREDLYNMLEQAHVMLKAKGKECNGLLKKVKFLEQGICELKGSHESLKEDHGELELAHTRLQKAHALLLEKNDKASSIIRKEVGTTCDIIDESFYHPIVVSPSIPSSSTLTHSTSTSSDDLTCDTSLIVENETLKREVDELTHALGKAYGGDARLLKCLGSQRFSLNKEGLGYIPKKGKKAFVTPKPSFVKSNGSYCYRCKQSGHQEHKCTKMNKNNKVTNVKSICFDSCYLLTKGEKGVKAKFIGTPIVGPKKKAIWVPKSLVANLQGPKKVWVPKMH